METVKKDKYGFEYFERLPEGYRLGNIDDFHIKGSKKVGMQYLLKRFHEENHYEIHFVKEWTEGKNLAPFFQWDMVYVKEEQKTIYDRKGKTNRYLKA